MTGSGEPVILLHSGGTSWHDWEASIPTLSQSYTVIAPDFPGCGNSQELDGTHDIEAYTMFLEHLIQTVGFSNKKIRLVGLSFGGMTALTYTLAHPDSVDYVALLAAAHRYAHLERRTALSILAALARNDLIRETAKWWIYQFGSRGWLLWLDLDTGRDFRRASSRATLEILQSWSELSIPTNQLVELRVPVLLAAAEKDKEVTLETIKELHSFLPNSQLLVVPDVSHYDFGSKNLGKGGILDQTILRFLATSPMQQ
jgi:pimeloyl-ACP methyl ester carboxylesterase